MTRVDAAGDIRVFARRNAVAFEPRQELVVPPRTTIAEAVELALPGLAPAAHVRVLVGDQVVPRELWARARPRPGTSVAIVVVPQGEGARSILAVVVTIAATAIAGPAGPGLGGSVAGAFGITSAGGIALTTSPVTGALTLAGGLLVQALVPLKQPKAREAGEAGAPSYSVSGFQNTLGTGAVVPNVLGRHRFAPPYGALPYTEIDGNDQYLTALFVLGYGPLGHPRQADAIAATVARPLGCACQRTSRGAPVPGCR